MISCLDVSIETHRIHTSHSPSALSGLPGYGAGDRTRALPAGAGTIQLVAGHVTPRVPREPDGRGACSFAALQSSLQSSDPGCGEPCALSVPPGAPSRPPGASIRWRKTGSASPARPLSVPSNSPAAPARAGRAATRCTRTSALSAGAIHRGSMPSSATRSRARTWTPAPSRRPRRGATVRGSRNQTRGRAIGRGRRARHGLRMRALLDARLVARLVARLCGSRERRREDTARGRDIPGAAGG